MRRRGGDLAAGGKGERGGDHSKHEGVRRRFAPTICDKDDERGMANAMVATVGDGGDGCRIAHGNEGEGVISIFNGLLSLFWRIWAEVGGAGSFGSSP